MHRSSMSDMFLSVHKIRQNSKTIGVESSLRAGLSGFDFWPRTDFCFPDLLWGPSIYLPNSYRRLLPRW